MDPKTSPNDKSWSALSLAWELGYIIAIPIVVLALLGRFLDKKLDTSPFLLLAGIFLSLIITSIGITRKTIKVMGNMEQNTSQNKDNLSSPRKRGSRK